MQNLKRKQKNKKQIKQNQQKQNQVEKHQQQNLNPKISDKNLDDCHFCKSEQVRVVTGFSTNGKQAMVVCADCGATTSFDDKFTYIDVMDRWTLRRGKSNAK